MKYLILIMLVGCSGWRDNNSRMTCEDSSWYLSRCENDEVVCYHRYFGGLSCKWKGE